MDITSSFSDKQNTTSNDAAAGKNFAGTASATASAMGATSASSSPASASCPKLASHTLDASRSACGTPKPATFGAVPLPSGMGPSPASQAADDARALELTLASDLSVLQGVGTSEASKFVSSALNTPGSTADKVRAVIRQVLAEVQLRQLNQRSKAQDVLERYEAMAGSLQEADRRHGKQAQAGQPVGEALSSDAPAAASLAPIAATQPQLPKDPTA